MSEILIYGIGNPGRQDDSLGISFAKLMEEWAIEKNLNLDIDYNYQLNIEDAARISDHKLVIFADASKEFIENFTLTRVAPKAINTTLSHAVNPESIVFLCKELFNIQPEAFIVHIKGYEWEFGEPLSAKAKINLDFAASKIQEILMQDKLVASIIHDFDNISFNPVKS